MERAHQADDGRLADGPNDRYTTAANFSDFNPHPTLDLHKAQSVKEDGRKRKRKPQRVPSLEHVPKDGKETHTIKQE